MMFPRQDPGECIVCGAARCACGGSGLEIVQLPGRDAAGGRLLGTGGAPPSDAGALARPLRAEQVQATLPPGQFTTGTYRGTKGKPRR